MSGKFPVWHAGRVELASSVLEWYRRSARDLPWRAAGATPWAVLVSEIMLQQTPVARVEPVYRAWLTRWPTPADLAPRSTRGRGADVGKAGLPAAGPAAVGMRCRAHRAIRR